MPKSMLPELWNSTFKQKVLYFKLPFCQCVEKTQASLAKKKWLWLAVTAEKVSHTLSDAITIHNRHPHCTHSSPELALHCSHASRGSVLRKTTEKELLIP